MPESPGFVAFAVELLGRVGPVRARAMFGGHGIYCGDLMIGLVDDDEIFLKTDAGDPAPLRGGGVPPVGLHRRREGDEDELLPAPRRGPREPGGHGALGAAGARGGAAGGEGQDVKASKRKGKAARKTT